jgi:hypothetical protein
MGQMSSPISPAQKITHFATVLTSLFPYFHYSTTVFSKGKPPKSGKLSDFPKK